MPQTPSASLKELRHRLGLALKQARQAKGITQNDLATLVDTDPETISRFERGTTLPSLARLLALSEALGVALTSLLGRASPRATDEVQEVQQLLASLKDQDRRLACDIVRTIAEARRP